jgi:hypothetical protein
MYKIVEVPQRAAESAEQLGTKYKFWYRDETNRLTLFKEGRPGTGENWAEKVASELAELLGMPHVRYEFARYEGREGVICPALGGRGAVLVHGNELLTTFGTDYEGNEAKIYQRREHTVSRVLSYFRASSHLVGMPHGFTQTERISSALDVFIGYLMFDAWIANQDRHDENWALLRTIDGNSYLAPSYDHGSSMGRNETDDRRKKMLSTRDMGQHVSKYVTTARSAFFPTAAVNTTAKALFTLDAFEQASRQSPDAANEWRERLLTISSRQVEVILENVPSILMTDGARRFTATLLDLNRTRILNCEILK